LIIRKGLYFPAARRRVYVVFDAFPRAHQRSLGAWRILSGGQIRNTVLYASVIVYDQQRTLAAADLAAAVRWEVPKERARLPVQGVRMPPTALRGQSPTVQTQSGTSSRAVTPVAGW